jgi:RNA polymerase sigma-54 factor
MMNQHLAQKQRLKILPQQIQLLNFFHLNTLELEQRIQQELQENPLLEEQSVDSDATADKYNKDEVQDYKDWDEFADDDIPDYKLEYTNYINSEKVPNIPVPENYDFRKDLKGQYRLLSSNSSEFDIADYLIDSLNDCGMLELDLEKVAEDLSFKTNTWVEADDLLTILKKVQQLEPVGVGARNTRECLLLQLHKMNTKRPDVHMAILLLEKYFADLHSRNMDKIKSHLKIDDDELRIILQLIGSLRMKPVLENTTGDVNQNIIPDFVVIQNADDLQVELYRPCSGSLHINSSWKEMAEGLSEKNNDRAAMQYLKSKLQSAQWFINAVQQRESTMLKIMKAIVQIQKEYFLSGDINNLKPMILKNVAEMVGVDISTVSRITCNKYVDTPFGILLLKTLFTEGIANQRGEVISNRVIQYAIEEVVENEDKKNPYTDQQLVAILSQKGFSVARRTVAKYREQLQIPVSHLRSLWA